MAAVANGNGYSGEPDKLRWQQETRTHQNRRFAFATDLIRSKLISSLQTLEEQVPSSAARDIAASKATNAIERLASQSFADMNDTRGGVPFDALWNVVVAFLGGNLHFIHLHGGAMKNGTARTSTISFYDEFDLDDA